MQKYLLLLLMCLVGMIEAQAGIKYEKIASGSYVLTFSNSSDATYSWSSLPNEVKTATSVTIVTEGTSKLSDSDVYKIIGDRSNDPFFTKLMTLDMSDAQLNNYSSLAFMALDKLKKLETYVFPRNIDKIPRLDNDKGMFMDNTHIKTVYMLEKDETGLSVFTDIPDKTFMNAKNLTTVRIPEGVIRIGESAFAGDTNDKAPSFEAIHFPNTLQRIEKNAFAYNPSLTSVTIPASVTFIGYSAFQYNKSMTDVYVLGNDVKIQDGAFNQEETYNFNCNKTGTVVPKDWKTTSHINNATPSPLQLHIPNNDDAKKRYMNPYLRALNDPRIKDEWLNSESAFNSNYGTIQNILREYEGVDPNQTEYFKPVNGEIKYVKMADGCRYFRNGNGKFSPGYGNSGKPEYGACGDYAGWRNFMLAATDLEKKIWNEGRLIESRWYSAVFPFDMTYNQVITTYGVGTDVREFSYVNQHESADGQIIRTVTFLKEPEVKDKKKDVYVKTGRPYMIHPGVRSVPVNPSTRSASNEPVYRTIAGVDVSAANGEIASGANLETVEGDLVNGNLRGPEPKPIEKKAYTFKGTYKQTDIPANTFFLGIKKGDLSTLGFYITRVELKDKWTAFTSVVRKTDDSSNSYAKSMDLGFTDIIEDNLGITTAVENAVVNESSKNNGVVYNLSGQAVRENNASLEGLSKGVYVVNGKKIVVR